MPTSSDRVPGILARTLTTRGWHSLTPVQRAVLKVEPANADLLVSAPTGSGKTVAFGLVCAGHLLRKTADPGTRGPYTLIITPTRELAAQVAFELAWLYGWTPVRVGCVTGGVDIRAERAALRRGFEILVGSPGRLRGHVAGGAIDLSQVGCLILDEADEMLDLGFRDDLEALLSATPPGRRTMMFTATLNAHVERLAQRYQGAALRIDLCPPHGHADIDFQAMQVAGADVEAAIVNTLRYHEPEAAIVFCNRRDSVNHLARRLGAMGFRVAALSGALDQQERTATIAAMREGRMRVCVASDVAARGLDLPQCSLVIHADVPWNRSALLHRNGRTGRGGRAGISVMVVPGRQQRLAEALIAAAGVTARWVRPPLPPEIAQRDQLRLSGDPLLSAPLSEAERGMASLLIDSHGAERLAAAYWRQFQAQRPVPRPIGGAGGPGQAADVWFALDRGSRDGATLGELLPMICRIGRLRRRGITRIRLLERETLFALTPAAASAFEEAVACGASSGARVRRLAGPPPRHGIGRGRRAKLVAARPGQAGDAPPPEPPAEA